MSVKWLIGLGFFIGSLSGTADVGFINLQTYDSTIKLDIRYATPNNFTKKVLYAEPKCVLRKPVAEALARVQSQVQLQGFRLKVFDCYRPLSVQKALWELVKDPRYVADPKQGSRHNRGASVDLTLIDTSGYDLEMPSEFDDFTAKAHRDNMSASAKAIKNRKRLEDAMAAQGFIGLPTEWWHFDFKDWEKYDVIDKPFSDFK